jgi:putative DNA primase/helicase
MIPEDWVRNLQRDADGNAPLIPDLLVQPYNDYGLGQRVVLVHGDRLRYWYEAKTGVVFVGTHWVVDRAGLTRALVQDCMVETSRQLLASGDKAAIGFANKCLNSARISNALLEAAPHLTITIDEMDQHAHLFNTRNCTVDLRTGTRQPHRRLDFITKLCPHEYHRDAQCPRFFQFVDQMLPGLRDYLQKLVGYTFTGEVREKKAFFHYGADGNNGKTTLFDVVRKVLGPDYTAVLPIEALMTKGENQNSNILAAMADLRGARLATTSETDEGQRLSEAHLKRLCQGMAAPIQAARKFEHPISFPESHKLWAECNHRPEVRGTDKATWGRMHLIPYDVTIPDDQIDRDLPNQLMEEAEGILAWAIEGAQKWYDEGLGTPAAVSAAGAQWRTDSDQVGQFINECCVTLPNAQARADQIYRAYRRWAEDSGEQRILSNVKFAYALASRGFTKDRQAAGIVYLGIGLRASQNSP